MKRSAQKRVANSKRRPAERYTHISYLTALTRGGDRAFPPIGELDRHDGETVTK